MKVEILKAAARDLAEGYRFYESQGPGLGRYFLSHLHAEIQTLAIYAGIHRQPFPGFHRLVCKRFPYAIHYAFHAQTATIHAVVDCRRDPDWILSKLKR